MSKEATLPEIIKRNKAKGKRAMARLMKMQKALNQGESPSLGDITSIIGLMNTMLPDEFRFHTPDTVMKHWMRELRNL